jgi:hypothetical protein
MGNPPWMLDIETSTTGQKPIATETNLGTTEGSRPSGMTKVKQQHSSKAKRNQDTTAFSQLHRRANSQLKNHDHILASRSRTNHSREGHEHPTAAICAGMMFHAYTKLLHGVVLCCNIVNGGIFRSSTYCSIY